jgi:hypothetical protein
MQNMKHLTPDHPAWRLAHWLERPESLAEFSAYCYVPDSLDDSRRLLAFPGGHDWPERLEELIDALGEREELAIHSNILIGGEPFHIPMIDFAAHSIAPAAFERISRILPEIADPMAYYQTDRSWHAYGDKLLASEEFVGFLARVLLVDKPGEPPVVDSRWIAHRLLAGRMALRISAQGGRHAFCPRQRAPN